MQFLSFDSMVGYRIGCAMHAGAKLPGLAIVHHPCWTTKQQNLHSDKCDVCFNAGRVLVAQIEQLFSATAFQSRSVNSRHANILAQVPVPVLIQ